MNQIKAKIAAYIAWATALAGTLGSLYFGEFMGLAICTLCWYQRILLYPLVLVLLVGILRKDNKMATYGLPLSIGGGLIAIYHNLLYYGVIPESLQPCVVGASCSEEQLQMFGFLDVPLLSLVGFIIITIALILHKTWSKNVRTN